MSNHTAKVTAVFMGLEDDFGKEKCEKLQVELDGFVGDRHRGVTRENWHGDKQVPGKN